MNRIRINTARFLSSGVQGAAVRFLLVTTLLLSMLAPVSSPAAEPGVNEVGIRTGIQHGNRPGHFLSYEAFANHRLPWDWRTASGLGVVPQVTSSLGFIQGAGDEGVFGSGGIAVVIDKNGPGFSTDIGTSAQLMSRSYFGNKFPGTGNMDFGSILQFVSYGGINYRFGNGLKIGYRWQHMSNGHIFYPSSNPNPGINMHLFGISRVF